MDPWLLESSTSPDISVFALPLQSGLSAAKAVPAPAACSTRGPLSGDPPRVGPRATKRTPSPPSASSTSSGAAEMSGGASGPEQITHERDSVAARLETVHPSDGDLR